jgi:hypothetical protein
VEAVRKLKAVEEEYKRQVCTSPLLDPLARFLTPFYDDQRLVFKTASAMVLNNAWLSDTLNLQTDFSYTRNSS